MRIIDLLQFIADLDKQTQFFYQNSAKEIRAITQIEYLDNQVILHTKKAKQHALHQWELVTLLNQITQKNNFVKIKIDDHLLNIFGLQLHDRKVYLK